MSNGDIGLNVVTTIKGDTAEIVAEGRITVSSACVLEEAITGAFKGGVTNAQLEMKDIEYISSAGLRVLVTGTKLATNAGGAFTLLHPTEAVYEVFEMTGLTDVFAIKK